MDSASLVLKHLLSVLESIVALHRCYTQGRWEVEGPVCFSEMETVRAHHSTFHRSVKYLLTVIAQCEVRAKFDFLHALAIRLDFSHFYAQKSKRRRESDCFDLSP